MKIMLDFGENDKPAMTDVMTTQPALFFDESEVKPVKPKPDDEEHLSPLEF